MAVETLVSTLPSEVLNSIDSLLSLLKIIGGVVIVYIVFSIINAILSRKKQQELKMINQNVEEIKNILLKRNSKKRK